MSSASATNIPAATPEARRPRRSPAARRALFWRRRVSLLAIVLLISYGGYAIFSGGVSSPRAYASGRPLPLASVTSQLTGHLVVPGNAGHFDWPVAGEGAVAVVGTGVIARSGHEVAVPIASLTKMMTALVILSDHPLELGESGPTLTMTHADASAWVTDSENGDSTVPVRPGEQLTEYQMLEALLLPSGDNIADVLAKWDAGSIAAFVTKMNAEARDLGLVETHYADTSGVNPESESTAAEQATVAMSLMSFPVAREIVAKPSQRFPVAGTIWNFNPALGNDGIVGVKSGYTSEAAGCLVTAAYRTIGGQQVLVIVASTGQDDGLYGAAATDEALLANATSGLVRFQIAPSSGVVADASVAWSHKITPLIAPSLPTTIVAWPGTVLTEQLEVYSTRQLVPGFADADTALGDVVVHSTGGLAMSNPVVIGGTVPLLPAGWSNGRG